MTADELNELMARTHLGSLLDLTDPTHTVYLLLDLIDAMTTALTVDRMLTDAGADSRLYRVISDVCEAILALHIITSGNQE